MPEGSSQEISLEEWCTRLPLDHRVNTELVELKTKLVMQEMELIKLRQKKESPE